MEEYEYPCCVYEFWLFLILCLVIVSLAGIASGLALGILSFSHVDLEVLIKAGNPKDKKHAGFFFVNYMLLYFDVFKVYRLICIVILLYL